jgi:hypothetical protein
MYGLEVGELERRLVKYLFEYGLLNDIDRLF